MHGRAWQAGSKQSIASDAVSKDFPVSRCPTQLGSLPMQFCIINLGILWYGTSRTTAGNLACLYAPRGLSSSISYIVVVVRPTAVISVLGLA